MSKMGVTRYKYEVGTMMNVDLKWFGDYLVSRLEKKLENPEVIIISESLTVKSFQDDQHYYVVGIDFAVSHDTWFQGIDFEELVAELFGNDDSYEVLKEGFACSEDISWQEAKDLFERMKSYEIFQI